MRGGLLLMGEVLLGVGLRVGELEIGRAHV